jgi:signal transduction histidine kinase
MVSPTYLVVRVADNGCGFDPETVAVRPGGGVGLQSLQERVKRLGGVFELDARPGSGVTLHVEMPLGEGRQR